MKHSRDITGPLEWNNVCFLPVTATYASKGLCVLYSLWAVTWIKCIQNGCCKKHKLLFLNSGIPDMC